MAKHLNPLEKEFLIRQFKEHSRMKLSDFCLSNGISDTAFRKWLREYEEGVRIVREVHERHRTHGYHWTAAYIRINLSRSMSDSYAYKCFRYLGIKFIAIPERYVTAIPTSYIRPGRPSTGPGR